MYSRMALHVRNLTTKLKLSGKCRTVVDHLCFDLTAGKTLALVGESGCGKSLTAHSLLRILPQPPALPPEGEVIFQGTDLLTQIGRASCRERLKSTADGGYNIERTE